jgi:hypothetical protein
MKTILRKAIAVGTSVLLAGLSVGMAAAANYPSPFLDGNVAIVHGTGEGVSLLDQTQAYNINLDLTSRGGTTSGGSGASVTGGDSVQIVKGSTRINLGDNVTTVWTAAVTDNDLSELLADGTYTNDENTEYAFTQKINFGSSLQFAQFSDSDYADKAASLAFKLSGSTKVLNYTLDFTTNAESDSVSGDLADIETTDLTLLGKTYYVLDASNSTDGADLTLLDAASTTTLAEGETTALTVGSKTYNVAINFIGSSTVKLDIDGEVTNTLSATSTQKLSDGSYVGVKEINTQDYAGGSKTVEFSIGAGKLKLANGSNIELNDVSIDDLTTIIWYSAGASASKEKIDKIRIDWTLEDEAYITPDTELLMPGFEAVKITMGELVFPAQEITKVDYSGDDVIELETTILDGDVTIPLFKGSTTTGNITLIGKATDERLLTDEDGTGALTYAAQSGFNEGFVASWNNSKEAESYYLSASVSRDSTTAKTNRTTIKNKVTGVNVCDDLIATDTCTIGNVVLTVDSVDYTSSSNRNAVFSINTGGTFNRLYTAEGLTVYLPYGNATTNTTLANSPAMGQISLNLTDANMKSNGYSVEYYTLSFQEEDKDGTLGAGSTFNVTIDGTGSSTVRLHVDNVYGAGSSSETERSSEINQFAVASELATIIRHDKTNSNQYFTAIEYHGEEVSADVFLTTPDASVSSGSSGTDVASIGNVVYKDSEKASWETMNVIVVGGSCINSAAAEALGVATGTCASAFTDATGVGSGQFLIQTVGDAFTTGRVALVVAGYNKEDTAAAGTYLTTQTVDTSAGMKYLGTSSTSAELIVE